MTPDVAGRASADRRSATPAEGVAAARAAAVKRVTAYRERLVELSHRIHAHPETAFEEHRAAGWCAGLLVSAGLTVREHAYGLPTAFEATAGSGPVTVVVCCEYDALPDIGHACGHNVIAAAGVGAGIALAEVADAVGLRVRVLGTPAEESGGGKIQLLDRGAFAGAHAAMMVHPAPAEVVYFGSLARTHRAVRYEGSAGHAAWRVPEARSAADALTLAQVAIGLLGSRLPVTCRVHGVVTGGDGTPNVVPARTAAHYIARAGTAGELSGLASRVEDCLRAAAQATGCTAVITRPEPDYLDFRCDTELAGLYQDNARALGRPPAVRTFPAASTDMGNVSHVVPAIHPTLAVGTGDAMPHQPTFAAACVTPAADRAMLHGAIAMAWTAIDLAGRRRLAAGSVVPAGQGP